MVKQQSSVLDAWIRRRPPSMWLDSLLSLPVAIMVVGAVSARNDKGYTEVNKLRYDEITESHERRGKLEMNSFVLIVLRLTW